MDRLVTSERDRHRVSFDLDPGNYEVARPPYPELVFLKLVTVCGLGPTTRVLEVGAGTGQATLRLAELAGSVVAVEPGVSLGERLRARSFGMPVEVVMGEFEAVEIDAPPFDLAACATSFHWLEASLAIPKFAALLRPGGWLALWWNVFSDPGRPSEFSAIIDPVCDRYGVTGWPKPRAGLPYPLDQETVVADVSRGGYFEMTDVEIIHWEMTHTAEEIRRLFATYSGVMTLPPGPRTELLDIIESVVRGQFGGQITRYYTTPIYLAVGHGGLAG